MSRAERVFISGAAGVIGREMLTSLSAHPEINVLAADKKPEPDNLPSNIEYRQGDLNDLSINELREFSPTIFIHLAATFERTSESLNFWQENFNDNLKLSHHLMGLMKELPSLRRVVFASSYLVYNEEAYQFTCPASKPTKISESASINPRNLVGMAKLTHEKELDFLHRFYKNSFSCISVRIFRGYGKGSRDVISRWIRSLLSNEEIVVYNPESVFDYIYAKDTAEGILKLALQSKLSGVFNLGSGESRSVSEVLATLERYFPKMKVRLQQSDSLFEASEADITKVTSEVDWKPNYGLESAISEIIEYEKTNIWKNEKEKNVKILITSSSHKAPLIRAIRSAGKSLDERIEVVAGDINGRVVSRFIADHFWEMPRLDEVNFPKIIDYCLDNQIGLVVPTRDGELSYWAKYKNTFAEKGIQILVSNSETIRCCLDKLTFYEFLNQAGINVIPTALDQNALLTKDRLVVKERFGSGSLNVGIGLEPDEATSYASKLINPIFQPLITGKEISADIWIIPGVYESVVLRHRTLVVRGESQITRIFRDENLERIFLQVAKKLSIVGPAVIQAIIDDYKVAHIIECNPRIGGASTASNAAGSNAFRKMIQHYLLGQNIGPIGKFERIQQITQIRSAFDEYTFDTYI